MQAEVGAPPTALDGSFEDQRFAPLHAARYEAALYRSFMEEDEEEEREDQQVAS